MSLKSLVGFYFSLGLSYSDILWFLSVNHGVIVSLRTLKRRLSQYRLFRRKNKSSIVDVALFVLNETQQSGFQNGYRWMHQKCLLAGFNISRSDVALLLSVLDPAGCEIRKKKRLRRRRYFSRGPNYLWHLDSYDKLKPYGICINGCIDGFSRKIIWCKVSSSTSDPRIIGGHFVEAIEDIRACPAKVRGDRGTENKYVAIIQSFLRHRDSFLYGASTSNQRIEAFWRMLRVQCCQFWIETFGFLKDGGYFDGGLIDKNLMQFVFTSVVQNDIDKTITVWNTHTIRPTKNQNVPNGKPCVMYAMPELYGTRDFKVDLDVTAVDACREECLFDQTSAGDPDLQELFKILLVENNLVMTTDPDKAVDNYLTLREIILAAL